MFREIFIKFFNAKKKNKRSEPFMVFYFHFVNVLLRLEGIERVRSNWMVSEKNVRKRIPEIIFWNFLKEFGLLWFYGV